MKTRILAAVLVSLISGVVLSAEDNFLEGLIAARRRIDEALGSQDRDLLTKANGSLQQYNKKSSELLEKLTEARVQFEAVFDEESLTPINENLQVFVDLWQEKITLPLALTRTKMQDEIFTWRGRDAALLVHLVENTPMQTKLMDDKTELKIVELSSHALAHLYAVTKAGKDDQFELEVLEKALLKRLKFGKVETKDLVKTAMYHRWFGQNRVWAWWYGEDMRLYLYEYERRGFNLNYRG